MVQLTSELVAELDRVASREGKSRSAVIRRAIADYLENEARDDRVRRWVDGYRRMPPAVPDDWGDLNSESERHGHELALRLDEEERREGLEW